MCNIYFVCPDNNVPFGGIKQMYRQVDKLNEGGFNAFILHENSGFKCDWFKNNTRIAYYKPIFNDIYIVKKKTKKKIKLKILFKGIIKKILTKISMSNKDIIVIKDDIFVFPEVFGPYIANLIKGNKKVIYNQGVYQSFFLYDLDLSNKNTPYTHNELIASIVNSENSLEYLNYTFPKLNVMRVHYGIDHHLFFYSENKKKQIAFMPRKLRTDLVQIINILKFRGALEGWELIEVQNMNEAQVAKIFRDSAIFLSLSINEGFGMPPAEAMACGCVVVGYPGKGGEEFFDKEFSFPVPDRNVLEFTKTLENVIKHYDRDPVHFKVIRKKASEFVLREYSLEREKKDIVNVWNDILKLR